MEKVIDISKYNYPLTEERIAKFPLERRDSSKLLLFKNNQISHTSFSNITSELPSKSLLVFNNTKVIRARMIFFKPEGARIEIFCLEPHSPADYERAFAVKESCQWLCMVGNLKKWKQNPLTTTFETGGEHHKITASRVGEQGGGQIIEFSWDDSSKTFGEMLEMLGRIPIPPYLNRESEESDNSRYQTVYSRFEGSVAAPTAGLHFTEEVLSNLDKEGFEKAFVTLHVGAGTFLPVKEKNAAKHPMHTEHFDITKETLEKLISKSDNIIAVGTTSVRTLESLSALGYRVITGGTADEQRAVGQWEPYDIPNSISGKETAEALLKYMTEQKKDRLHCSTRIMITPEYRFRFIKGIVTNFHQPQSTLLLLISALVGERWHDIYDYALANDFRFLSYGDSSLLIP